MDDEQSGAVSHRRRALTSGGVGRDVGARDDLLHTWFYRLLGIVVLVLWLGTVLTWIR